MGTVQSRARWTAQAGLALSAALLGLALPGSGVPAPSCPEPGALPADPGGSPPVACRGRERGLPDLRGPARRVFGLPIDANRADPATLETLPGIGPVRARAIVRERARRPFSSVADLARVRGVGPHTLGRLAPWLTVGHRPGEKREPDDAR